MIKLLNARFQNFRLLSDLRIEFSGASDKKLTVIRAANESGKTTILHALQWTLYGDDALPGKGKKFRLHPVDWDTNKSKRVPITGIVEFEETTYRRKPLSSDLRAIRRRYRLVRTASEYVDNYEHRSPSTTKLFQIDDEGAKPLLLREPESLISETIPFKLREVFFTDGDRALSFIEADATRAVKRERVEYAIRSLLNLDTVDGARRRVNKSKGQIDKKVKQADMGNELSLISSRLVEINKDQDKQNDKLKDAKQQLGSFDKKLEEIDRKLEEALKKGDKEKLQKERTDVRDKIDQLDKKLDKEKKDHSRLFRSESIAADLLTPVLKQVFRKLEELHDQGKIPSMTIPVLRERLSAEICICSETLAPSDPDGVRRRESIQNLIEDSQRADKIQEIITDLYYGTKPLLSAGEAEKSTWLQDYRKVTEHRYSFEDLREEEGRKLAELETQLDSLPDTDIQGLRKEQRWYKDMRDNCLRERTTIETKLDSLKKEYTDLERKRDRLLREHKKYAKILAESEITKDVEKVLQSTYDRIIKEELPKVSDLMNSIFLEMIGADPEQGAIIQRAKINKDFDIIVHGPDDRMLDPDRDLNGASRRALTLAFILALTKVSEVQAPNVIDTPLGMTSGYVRHSILKTAVRESAQLVLFLTHDEIVGCEDIIDEAAGVIFTLTNAVHYPKMLVNDPGVTEHKILRCECDHRRQCPICERRTDTNSQN